MVLYRDTTEGTALDLLRRHRPAGWSERRNVGRAIRCLEGRGLVKVVHRGGLRQGESHYRVRGVSKDG
jgi:hypothetical protein